MDRTLCLDRYPNKWIWSDSRRADRLPVRYPGPSIARHGRGQRRGHRQYSRCLCFGPCRCHRPVSGLDAFPPEAREGAQPATAPRRHESKPGTARPQLRRQGRIDDRVSGSKSCGLRSIDPRDVCNELMGPIGSSIETSALPTLLCSCSNRANAWREITLAARPLHHASHRPPPRQMPERNVLVEIA